ncbi:MAG: pantoate--beta-alanine ligase [Bacteroidales bacterium]|jgi:pantoate--beta-alanine ligase|nr:pantoate--beta-alanine ligase [Bacteroidales bacterium]
MFVFERKTDLNQFVNQAKADGKTIGFVPTMGALHSGHLALVSAAKECCSKVVASIFVNPLQFNNPDDLKKYPRTFESDKIMLEDAGCDAVFFPAVKEMYPNPDEAEDVFNFGTLETVMEGASRPGHFNGVAIVVKKLFDLVQPDKAFFGKKDFQQLAIIKALVKQTASRIQIIGLDTVREEDGLAMSSRNRRLSKQEREDAVELSQALNIIKKNKNILEPASLETEAVNMLSKKFRVEYVQIIDGHSLQQITNWNQSNYPVVCAAAFIGDVRLIDNLEL